MSVAQPQSVFDQATLDDHELRDCGGLQLLIVGGGMASFGLCKRLVTDDATSRQYQITVFGDEPSPAYDRVNLSKLFQGKSAEDLQLASASWYQENGIKLVTGCRIASVDTAKREIVDQTGVRHPYHRLVLATGSRPRIPPIQGADQEGVFVYRTLDDLRSIQEYAERHQAKVGTVIGGGLLGLEAAKVLQDLGLKTSVIEMAPGLMPRQLDAKAAALLRERIEELGVDVHLVRRTKAIEKDSDRLVLQFDNAEPLTTDLLIIAAGVVPNDELARESGLAVGPRGGIVVNETLQTSDPHVHAIGECVSFRSHVYGLAAPCFRMADVLARRLSGINESFQGADESAELKLLGVKVAVLGQAIGDSPAGITLTHQDQEGYRKLLLHQGSIVGAACVGQWDELPQIRQAVNEQQRLWPWQRGRFHRSGSPWSPGGAMAVADWPSASIVCSCNAVTKGELTSFVSQGIDDPIQLAEVSGASTACGSCRSLVCELAGADFEADQTESTKPMLVASLVGAFFVALMVALPPVQLAESVQAGWRRIDVLWRSDFARQVTGYSLLAVLLLGLVFSLRKRFSWFQFGSYGFWRSMHGVLGAAVILAMAVHTGLHLGDNLNFLLSVTFLSVAALGTFAGLLSSLESRLTGTRAIWVRAWRPRLTRIHLWLFWPVPLLIALHVFSFYWFRD